MWQGRGYDKLDFGCAQWLRVSRQQLCPICRKPNWCGISPDGSAAICMRISQGAVNKCRNGGWLHILDHSRRPPSSPRRHSRSIPLTPQHQGAADWSQLAQRYANAVEPARLLALSEGLGLSEDSLRRLSIGWSMNHRAWTFPMCDARGNVRGVRLRCTDGPKLTVRGGKEGLFLPAGLSGSLLLISEGPTDCCALLDLGFAAIGRPSCRGAVQFTAEFVRTFNPAEVVIVADDDEAGGSGADSLASTLLLYTRRLRIITPPHGISDARAWKCAGTTHTDVLSVIEATAVRSLSITAGGTHGPR